MKRKTTTLTLTGPAQVFRPELTDIQSQTLGLLGVSETAFSS